MLWWHAHTPFCGFPYTPINPLSYACAYTPPLSPLVKRTSHRDETLLRCFESIHTVLERQLEQ